MSVAQETLVLRDIDAEFTSLTNPLEAEQLEAAMATFENNLAIIDTIDPRHEAEISTITMGKMVGCQDTGGGGYEWEKIV